MALTVPGGPEFVTALRRIWDDGDAAFPLDPRLPAPAASVLLETLRPAIVRSVDGETRLPDARPTESDDALVVATSGTSGRPKGVVLTHAAIEASARATSARIGVRADDHWLACLPLAHVGGLSVVTRALTLGTPLTVLPGFDADMVSRSTATLVSLVPTALRRVDASRFRVIVLGGTRPPADRPSNCVTTYGMTETGSGVVYDGVPLEGVDVHIAEDGGIRLRGPMLLRAYRGVGDGDRFESDPKGSDGWFDTGDVGRWENSSGTARLAVDGRRGDVIVTGAEKVWPDTVERALGELPDVSEYAVAGSADPEWGQVVVVHLVPLPGTPPPTLESLRERVKRTLPAYCAPRRLVITDSLPRTNLGKVRRNELRG